MTTAFGTWVKVKDGREVYIPAEEAARPRRERRAGYRLSLDEKRKLAAQLGHPVEDYAQLKRIYREQGLRDLERGEPAFTKKDMIAEWVRGGAKGPNPVGQTSITMPQRPRESFGEWVQRKKAEGDRHVR